MGIKNRCWIYAEEQVRRAFLHHSLRIAAPAKADEGGTTEPTSKRGFSYIRMPPERVKQEGFCIKYVKKQHNCVVFSNNNLLTFRNMFF